MKKMGVIVGSLRRGSYNRVIDNFFKTQVEMDDPVEINYERWSL